jgi:cystathionine beta-synthase
MNSQQEHTPLYKSDLLSDMIGCKIYIKGEYYNPGETSKYRVAKHIIAHAERTGLLKAGDTLVEASSGNTAIGVAIISQERNYNCIIFVSESSSPEKIKLIQDLGAEIMYCANSNGLDDTASSQYKALQYSKLHPNTYYCNQYFNPENSNAHFETTGPEIWSQTEGQITHFIAGAGTGGTLSGVSHFLKMKNNRIKTWAVDPCGSVLTPYFKGIKEDPFKNRKYKIEGIGRSFIPGNMNFDVVDDFIQVDEKESAIAAYEYLNSSGFAVGYSSGAVLAALLKQKKNFSPEDYVVLLFSDKGDRYKSKLYNPEWLQQHVFSKEEWLTFYKKYYKSEAVYV